MLFEIDVTCESTIHWGKMSKSSVFDQPPRSRPVRAINTLQPGRTTLRAVTPCR